LVVSTISQCPWAWTSVMSPSNVPDFTMSKWPSSVVDFTDTGTVVSTATGRPSALASRWASRRAPRRGGGSRSPRSNSAANQSLKAEGILAMPGQAGGSAACSWKIDRLRCMRPSIRSSGLFGWNSTRRPR
jgi:hypothetical protein